MKRPMDIFIEGYKRTVRRARWANMKYKNDYPDVIEKNNNIRCKERMNMWLCGNGIANSPCFIETELGPVRFEAKAGANGRRVLQRAKQNRIDIEKRIKAA